MANITLTFTNPLPEGIQVGDIAWYLDNSTTAEIKMGPITSITSNPVTIIVNASAGVQPPLVDDFIFYAKDPIAVVSSLKGYFAEAQFVNDSTSYAELFSVGAEIFESSK
mgnify:CR=1 FL=1|tara:strand:+ start:1665 stop:1994 length:330 start_codon:yes stop_codon:yes gene_type:complete